jgi:hypothetical protein
MALVFDSAGLLRATGQIIRTMSTFKTAAFGAGTLMDGRILANGFRADATTELTSVEKSDASGTPIDAAPRV